MKQYKPTTREGGLTWRHYRAIDENGRYISYNKAAGLVNAYNNSLYMTLQDYYKKPSERKTSIYNYYRELCYCSMEGCGLSVVSATCQHISIAFVYYDSLTQTQILKYYTYAHEYTIYIDRDKTNHCYMVKQM